MDQIDKIIYINLKHRQDREKGLLETLKNIDIPQEKLHKIDAELTLICGHLGCGLSHIKALEYAIQNNYNQVLILEDDFRFTQSKDYINTNLNKLFKNNDWDVALFTYGHHYPLINIDNPDLEKFKKITGGTTASGYIVKNHFFNILLKVFRESVEKIKKEMDTHIQDCNNKNIPITKMLYASAIDVEWHSLQDKYTFYTFEPVIGKQDGGWSDNNNSLENQLQYIY